VADIGYFEQIEGGVYGTANPATDPSPEDRYALQAASAALAQSLTTVPGYVPPSYERQGTGALPTVGWTCQNPNGPVFPPYTPTGRTPDWNAEGNPAAGGSYDMTSPVAYGDYNPLNRAPLGEGVLQYDDTPNPNSPPNDISGSGDLEW
jgi:hypothetical protein